MIRILSLFSVLLAAVLPAWTQQPGSGPQPRISQLVKTQWTRDQGLPSDNIAAVLQDTAGYIWVGTYEGLVRFNGADFKLVTPSTIPGFPLKSARVLAMTPLGMAVGSNGEGFVLLNGKEWTAYGSGSGLSNLNVRAFAWDNSTQRLYIGTTGGLFYLEGGTVRPAELEGRENRGTVEALYADPQGKLWISFDSAGEIYSLQGTSKGLRFQAPWSAGAVVRAFCRTGDGSLLMGTRDQGLFQLSGNTWISWAEKKLLEELRINEILEDRSGGLWIGTDAGLYKKNQEGMESFTDQDGLVSGLVDTLWEDQESNIWLGSSRGGLTKLSRSKFLFFTPRQGLADGVVNALVVLEGNRSVMIGTDRGLSVLDSRGNPVNHPLVGLTAGERIRHLLVDRWGRLWIGTYGDRGVLVWDGLKLKSYGTDSGLSGIRIRQIFEDSRGGIWVATTSGLNRMTNSGWKIYDQKTGLENHYILGMTEDDQGRLWLGTDGGGIYSLDPEKEFLVHYGPKEGVVGQVVFKIIKAPGNSLLAVTNGGLARYHDGSWNSYREGLPLDTFFQALPGQDGWWLTATQGLLWLPESWFRDRTGWQFYSRPDGLFADVTPASWGDESGGRLWLPTLKGAAFFDPSSQMNNPVVPPLVLEEVRVEGIIQDVSRPLVIPAGARRLDLAYAGLSYQYPSQVRYKTRLRGFDEAWSQPTSSRTISYTNLSPGTYTFQLLAANNDGLWTAQPLEMTFRQEAPFYLNWWFFLLEGIALVLGVTGAFRLWAWRALRQRRHLELLVSQRTRELHHEKEKSDQLLLSILPAPIAHRLKSGERVIADSLAEATIIFCDIVEFTPLAATREASQLVELLNGLFSEYDFLCRRHGVEKIKTIGDAYMAASGVPQPAPDHAQRICRLALDMRKTLKTFNETTGNSLKMRFGIHTGGVTAGVIGHDKFIYDLWGDAVNVASRLENTSLPDRIQISEDVKNLLPRTFRLEGPNRVQLKGKGETTTWYLEEGEEHE